MQAKHTPGPCRAIGAAVHAPARHADSQRIADCRALLPDAELRANAALIAAAPDMLAALHEVRRCIVAHGLHGDATRVGYLEEAEDIIRVAIARATGEA